MRISDWSSDVCSSDLAQVPLGELARIEVTKGAPSIRTENAMLAAYIYVDTRESDLGRYVQAAQDAVAEQVQFPPGYYVTWSGQYEYMQRAAEKMRVVVPVTLALIFLLRSEEHTSELQSLMRISFSVFCFNT